MTLPPETNQRQRISASRSRRYAREHGWVPPLALEDETHVETEDLGPDLDEQARIEAASVFERWQALLAGTLRAMVAAGQLQPEADLDRLALATLASLQGGLLLAKTTRTTAPVEAALDAAIAHLRAFAVAPGRRSRSSRRTIVTRP